MRSLAVALVALALAGPAVAGGNPVAGKTVFRSKCGSCHTFAAAATHSRPGTGPALTGRRITVARLQAVLTGSSAGIMPSFLGVLTPTQINDVIAFVVKYSK